MRILIFLAAILLAFPLASAQGGTTRAVGEMQVDEVAMLHAGTMAVNVRGNDTNFRTFHVESDYIRVELDSRSTEFSTGSGGSNGSTTILHEGPGRLVTDQVREDHQINLISGGVDARLETNGFSINPKATEYVKRSGGSGSNRPAEEVHMGPQFELNKIEGMLYLSGNFSFTLWEWDASIEHAGGREGFWTGSRYEAPHPLLEPLRPYGHKGHWQTAYVFVEDGTLALQLHEDDVFDGYMGPATGRVGGHIRLTPPSQVPPELNLLPETQTFEGTYTTFLDVPRAGELYATLTRYVPPPHAGDAPSGGVGDEVAHQPPPDALAEAGLDPHAGAVPGLPAADLPPWTYLLALPALLLAAAAVAYVRPVRRLHKLEDAYDLGIYDYLVDNAPPLLRSRRFGARASLMYTVALLEERGPDEAEAHLLDVRSRSRPVGATHDFLMARIRAAQTRFDEARRHVHACLAAEPAFVVEVRRDASLEFLMRPPSDPGEGYT